MSFMDLIHYFFMGWFWIGLMIGIVVCLWNEIKILTIDGLIVIFMTILIWPFLWLLDGHDFEE